MKTIRLFVSFAVAISLSHDIMAQADPLYRQNQTNILMLNPAQAGSNEYNEINVLGSNSWVGFEGAPRTFAFSGNFNLNNGLGLGVTAFSDETGPVRHNNLGFNLAKHIKLNNHWKLSLGLKASVSSLNIDLTSLNTTVADDPLMQRQLSSGIRFDVGWGALAYSENFFVGVAQPRVLDIQFFDVDMVDYIESKGIIAYAGHNHKIKNQYDIRSFIMYRYIPGNPLFLDAGSTISITKTIDLGAIYQLNSAVGAFFGLNVSENLYFGYTYSYPTSKINRISIQSHEVLLRFKFNNDVSKNNNRFVGPRFFN
jgi:type IX secretion system PorP/SprF family membrane protein